MVNVFFLPRNRLRMGNGGQQKMVYPSNLRFAVNFLYYS